jgi:hypothetical protein
MKQIRGISNIYKLLFVESITMYCDMSKNSDTLTQVKFKSVRVSAEKISNRNYTI